MLLEIGCGEHPQYPQAVKVDIRSLPCVDIVADAADLYMLGNESFSGIFTRHVIEHWPSHMTVAVLREWYRVLKPGGWLELHCPDLDKLIQNYLCKSVDIYTQKVFDADLLSYYLYGSQDYPENTHKAGFTFDSMKHKLELAGFKSITRLTQFEDPLEMRLKAWK